MRYKRLTAILVVAGMLLLVGGAVTDTVRGQQKVEAQPDKAPPVPPKAVIEAPAMAPAAAVRMQLMQAQVQGKVVFQPIGPGGGMPGMPGGPMGGDKAGGSVASQLSGIKIIEKSEFRQVINVARDCVKDKAWEEAVTALQALLDNKEDHYVQVRDKDAQGKEVLRWTSVKFEANNLLGTMPAEGLEVYELRYGGRAKDKLDEAKKKGDRELLAEVAQRYCHTKAGIEANELLATLFLARGQHFMAALRYEKLLAMDPERAPLNDLTLYKAALAFRRAGDTAKADEVWKKLAARVQVAGGLRVGDQVVPVAKLREVLDEEAGGLLVNPYEWAMIRGNLTNTGQATGSPPLLDTVLWQRPVLNDKRQTKDKEGKVRQTGEDEFQAKLRVEQAIKHMRDAHLPVLPGFFPIATKGLLVYRTHSGIRAVAIKEVKDAKGSSYKPGEIVWNSFTFSAGLANLLDQNTEARKVVETWLTGAGAANPNPGLPNVYGGMYYFHPSLPGVAAILYENSTIGTLSTDHQYVYAVDDLAVPPPFNYQLNPYMPQQISTGAVQPFVRQNTLMAFNLEKSGKLEWDLGGKDDPVFTDSYFLGPPISVGGKLYVLNEKNPPNNNIGAEAELRLVCIDPTKKSPQNKPAVVEPIQLLGMVSTQNRFGYDLTRRTNAAHLAFGEGILVCTTNAGEVFGVDLMSRSLVWSYPYRETQHNSPFGMGMGIGMPGGGFAVKPGGMTGPALAGSTMANWKSSPPAIADGKVVFTAPDATSVHCINLRDGTPVWKSPQQDGDLYMAGVFNGKVLIVGKSSIRALNLQNKHLLWSISTGHAPSGQGVASKGVYYLPLSNGEIFAVDIDKGTVKAHNRAAGDAAKFAPGNLVFYEGCVLSLTPTDVIAYPQLEARLADAANALKADPENLEKLTNHGELLLKDGQVQAAVNELEKAVARKPDGEVGRRARDRLHEALTDLLQADFSAASGKYLDLYGKLCGDADDAAERQMRKAKYFRIVGEGREKQGNLVEAFEMYKDFGALPIHNEAGGVAALDDPSHKVPINVWLRGRVSAMIAGATPQQKAPLEAKIAEEWKGVLAKKDLGAIRSFVGMFDVPFEVGREARLHLAEAIIEQNDKGAFLEAELNLQQLLTGGFRHQPAVGGRALAALALLEEKKGTADAMRLAASYYRELARDFAKAEVRKGKTGADLFNELAADKRFLPYLEEAGPGWGTAKIAARKIGPGGYAAGLHFLLSPEGELSPFAKQHRVAFDPNNPVNTTLRLIDTTTGKERWAQNLGQVASNNQIFFQLYQQNNINLPYGPNARHRFYHVKGHLIVCQVGLMAYCVDGDTGKVLWRQPLVEGLENTPNLIVQPAGVDEEGNPEFIIFNPQFGRPQGRLSLGQVGAAEASYVALLTQKGLTVNDPLRGTLLWKKTDVAPGTRVFGDEEYLFLVEGGEGGAMGAGRVLRANDGVVMDKVPDFGPVYQNRVRVQGRRILAAVPGKNGLTLRLYDIVAGKDVWSKVFDPAAVVLRTEDPGLTGVIDAKGTATVLDAATGQEILSSSVLGGRIGPDEIKSLKDPLLLADADRFYFMLNRPTEGGKLAGGQVHSNFSNGLRCIPVNGWVVALHRKDGERRVGEHAKAFKKGEFAWHSLSPLAHQMVVVEQFDQLPVLLFTARYNEPINGGLNGFRWQTYTQSLDKQSGKFIYDNGPEANNASPQFFAFTVDPRGGTINLIGYTGVIQHYLDDGRKPPQTGQFAPPAADQPFGAEGGPAVVGPPGLVPPGGVAPLPVMPALPIGGVKAKIKRAIPAPAQDPPPPAPPPPPQLAPPPGGGALAPANGAVILPGADGPAGGVKEVPAPVKVLPAAPKAPPAPGGFNDGINGQVILPWVRINRNLEVVAPPPPAKER
jgi:outer membrane protein assembly factor BamB/tetratricopeptide (TPR) repeat protein